MCFLIYLIWGALVSELACTVCDKAAKEHPIEVNGYRSVAKGVLLPYAICKPCLSIMDGQVVNYQKSQEKRQAMLALIDEKLLSVYQAQKKSEAAKTAQPVKPKKKGAQTAKQAEAVI